MDIYSNNDPVNISWIKEFNISIGTTLNNNFNLQAYYKTSQSHDDAIITIASSSSLKFKEKDWTAGHSQPIPSNQISDKLSVTLKKEDLNKVWAIRITYAKDNTSHDFRRILLFSEVDVNLIENGDNATLFPERNHEQYKDRIDTGVCFSGGGTRAMIMAMGQMRYLHRKGYSKNIGYYSSVSGGSWATTIYDFSPQKDITKLLGTYTEPENYSNLINRKEVPEMAFGTMTNNFAISLIINTIPLFVESFLRDKKDTLNNVNKLQSPFSRWWINSVGSAFFTYNDLFSTLNPESFTLDKTSLDKIMKNNGSLQRVGEAYFKLINTTRENGYYPPYYIANSLMLRPTNGKMDEYIPYEYTPLYQGAGFNGSIKKTILNHPHIGGGNSPMYVYDTQVISKVENDKVWVMRQTSNSLANLTTASGTSSSAIAGFTSEFGEVNSFIKLLKYLYKFLTSLPEEQLKGQLKASQQLLTSKNPLKEHYDSVISNIPQFLIKINELIKISSNFIDAFTPKANYFSPKEAQNKLKNIQFNFGDAGLSDNFGLMALLRRKVKKVVIFVNTETEFEYKNNKAIIDDTIKAFFGLGPKNTPGNFGIRLENMQVFKKSLFEDILQDFKRCQDKGESLISQKTYTVSPNKDWDVSGDYDVNILWHYNCRPTNWEKVTDNKVLDKLDNQNNGLLNIGKFPHYNTLEATINGLNEFEINMLSNIAEWNLEQTDKSLADMFSSKKTPELQSIK